MTTIIYGFTILLILGALITMGAYIYSLVRRLTKSIGSHSSKHWIHNLIPVGIALTIILCIFIHTPLVLFVMFFIATSMFVDIIFILCKKIFNTENKTFKIISTIHGIYIIPVIVAIVTMLYGHYNMMNIDKTSYEVYTDKNIQSDGYRICLIADLHFGSSIDLDDLKEICKEISQQNIDIMVLCGDIVDENTEAKVIPNLFKVLGTIDSTYGTYFVHGNHDCQTYATTPAYTKEELEKHITDNDITILDDKTLSINEELVLIGRNDAAYTNNPTRLSINELLKDVNPEQYIIVLDHQPKEYNENAQAGTDLLLSGHTHAGQFWPLNILLEIIPFNDGTYGLKKIKNTNTIVTSGISGWAFPYRTSGDSEYVIIDVKPQ